MALNCIGTPIGSVVVSDNCVEPKFGLAFQMNGSHVSISNNCSGVQPNIIKCFDACCYVPIGMSINVSLTDLELTMNETRVAEPSPLPPPLPNRRFVCVETNI